MAYEIMPPAITIAHISSTILFVTDPAVPSGFDLSNGSSNCADE
jgi:hypothetical protein